ncbi:MAG: hypothetical protein BGP06_04580 [Rhizobiales bacterium 65-9]|nr:hypothetical protein [Hyphomicrobiales bacterium]OJY32474.1 MAG: hypothetical protein BGP06_04580 [Rhizobiales bacterium 65-9]
MTTKRQIRKLLSPFADRHADLVFVHDRLFLKPIDHVLVAIWVDRSSSADSPRPQWSVTHSCNIIWHFPVMWTMSIPSRRDGWRWSEPWLEEHFTEVVEQEVLPLLKKLRRLEFFASSLSSIFEHDRLQAAMLDDAAVKAALGLFDAAREVCETLLSRPTRFAHPFFAGSFERVTQELYPLLLEDDRSGVAALLHRWEAATIGNFGLEAVWTPSPFPLERAGSVNSG